MKKSVIAVIALLLIIALLPILGNTFVKQTIDDRLVQLESFGLEVQKDESKSSYLETSRHFEILLKDSKAFMTYLSQYSDKQIPPYVNAMLDGVTIGVDLEYSNLPFAKAFEVEFYPMTLSHELELSFEQNDMGFYKFVKKFLNEKGVLYHVNYNLLNNDFDGYIKDIDEKYKLKSGVDMALLIKKANFKGNGALLAPQELYSSLQEFRLDAAQEGKKFHIVMNKFSTTSNFASEATYLTSGDLSHLEVDLMGTEEDTRLLIENIRVNASSNDQGSDVELNSKSSLEKLVLKSKNIDVNLSKFNFDIALSGLEKQSFKEFSDLASDSNTMSNPQSSQKMQQSFVKLLSQGMLLKIADFSIKNVETNLSGDLKGFELESTVRLNKDDLLADKMKVSPLLALSGLDIETNLKVSKEMFNFLAKKAPMLTNVYKYAKEEGGNLVFKLGFKDSKPTINGQPLR